MRGLKWEPLAPWNSAKAFRTYIRLALQPTQNICGLGVLGTLDVLTSLANAFLDLLFERSCGNWWWWWQASSPLQGDLVEHFGEIFTILLVGFTSDQSTFGLK